MTARVRAGVALAVAAVAAAVWLPGVLTGTAASPPSPLARFLLAVAVVLGVCHLLGALMRRWGQPPVLGEMLGGLLLGPSALGLLWPAASGWLFPSAVTVPLGRAADFGLVLFLFVLGAEMRAEPRGLRAGRLPVIVLAVTGVPLVAGAAVGLLGRSVVAGDQHRIAGGAFLGLAIAITALPVLARVLFDQGLAGTHLGTVSLSAAAAGDATAWTVLAIILGTVGAAGSAVPGATPGLAVALVLLTVWGVRPGLKLLERRLRDHEHLLWALLMVGAIGYAAVTELIGLHAAIGGFAFGLALPAGSPTISRMADRLGGFTTVALLPLFFAEVGLSTSAGVLGHHPAAWLMLGAVLLVAVLGKMVGARAVAGVAGLDRRDASRFAVLMNCRGVTELVVAGIGLSAGLINQTGFLILVLMALLTTAVTGPLLHLLRTAERPAEPAPTAGNPEMALPQGSSR